MNQIFRGWLCNNRVNVTLVSSDVDRMRLTVFTLLGSIPLSTKIDDTKIHHIPISNYLTWYNRTGS